MQSIQDTEATTEFVTADELRDMTISQEELFERQKANLLDTLFGNMVKLATESGLFFYEANLNPKFDPVLLATLKGEFEGLGYEVQVNDRELQTNEGTQAYKSLVISWNASAKETVAEAVESATSEAATESSTETN